MSHEKITPIVQGERIKLEKLLQSAKNLREERKDLFQEAYKVYEEKKRFLDEEFNKPTEARDYPLIGLLQDDLRNLEEIMDSLIDAGAQGATVEEGLRQRIFKIQFPEST